MADETSREELEALVKSLQIQVNDLSAVLDVVSKGTEKITRRFI